MRPKVVVQHHLIESDYKTIWREESTMQSTYTFHALIDVIRNDFGCIPWFLQHIREDNRGPSVSSPSLPVLNEV